MFKGFLGREKYGIRFLAWILALIIFVTSFPGQALVTKAEVREDWKSVQEAFSILDGSYGKDILLVLKNDGTISTSVDGNRWDDIGKIEISDSASLSELKITYCGEFFYVYGVEGHANG